MRCDYRNSWSEFHQVAACLLLWWYTWARRRRTRHVDRADCWLRHSSCFYRWFGQLLLCLLAACALWCNRWKLESRMGRCQYLSTKFGSIRGDMFGLLDGWWVNSSMKMLGGTCGLSNLSFARTSAVMFKSCTTWSISRPSKCFSSMHTSPQ
jgi:hypothetical protein